MTLPSSGTIKEVFRALLAVVVAPEEDRPLWTAFEEELHGIVEDDAHRATRWLLGVHERLSAGESVLEWQESELPHTEPESLETFANVMLAVGDQWPERQQFWDEGEWFAWHLIERRLLGLAIASPSKQTQRTHAQHEKRRLVVGRALALAGAWPTTSRSILQSFAVTCVRKKLLRGS